MSPEEIINRALGRFERPLISHANTITGDLESARDAVQETFLRLSRQDVSALEPRLAPWLFFVCRNCAPTIPTFDDASSDFQFATAVAVFEMKLLNSPTAGNITWSKKPPASPLPSLPNKPRPTFELASR